MKAEEVKKLAELSRIKISQKEIKEFTEQLSSILDYVNKVQEYKFVSQKHDSLDEVPELREDLVAPEETEEIIKQFSDHSGKLLKVKKIL
jgi:aspartyl/glutamyl-tRNA(Asn/Gln) amidotransferase C subunit